MTNNPIPKKWKYAAIALVAFVVIWTLLSMFWLGGLKMFEQNRQAGETIAESEMNGENAIDNYEWFKQQKQDIEAKERQANNTKAQIERMRNDYEGSPSDWPRDTRKQYERLNQQLLGQQNMHNQMVADYNARSNMQNRNVFKDSLPYEMEKKFWTGDGR